MIYRILHLAVFAILLHENYTRKQTDITYSKTSGIQSRPVRKDVYMIGLHQNNENSNKKCNRICFLYVYKYDIFSLKWASSTQITLRTGRYWVPTVWRMTPFALETHCSYSN